ncbi:MAG: hypothetical protein ACI30I_04365 [Parabacteroides sp.]
MNVNSRIDWHTGMEISAQTFIEFDENIARRQQVALRIANGNLCGLIPETPFQCHGLFVKNTLEIDPLVCMALLPSGRILHVDERVTVTIPMLYGDEYYLAGKIGEQQIGFDKETVPFVSPQSEFALYTLAELSQGDLFPVMKFKVNNGVFSIDDSYIPPHLVLAGDPRYAEYLQQFIGLVRVLAEHANLESGEGKRCLIRYTFLLKNYSQQNRVHDLFQLLQEIMQAVDYYVVSPHTDNPTPTQPGSLLDTAAWFVWLEGYLRGAATLLDKVVLEDHTIDFEALKEQVRIELYNKLYPELYENLKKELKDSLRKEIHDELYQSLTGYVNETLKPQLKELLKEELSDELYDKLFQELYEGLFKALYVPSEEEEEEKEFIPLI